MSIYEYHFLSYEACCSEPEKAVIIVRVYALEEGVDEFSAAAGEDPFIVSAEEKHAQLDSRCGRLGFRVPRQSPRHFHDMRGSFAFP